jgi:hypothetical protein
LDSYGRLKGLCTIAITGRFRPKPCSLVSMANRLMEDARQEDKKWGHAYAYTVGSDANTRPECPHFLSSVN